MRLVTLTGPGGVGKTRLALQLAEDLVRQPTRRRPIRQPGECDRSRACGGGDRQCAGTDARRGCDAARPASGALAERELLLILDNFEHVLPAAPLLSDLLTGCPQLQLLVTSRALLRLSGEHVVDVAPLPTPDSAHIPPPEQLGRYPAVRLFVERARALQPAFELTASNAESVGRICAQLDGLPLALELAAARIRLLPPETMAARLERSLAVLTVRSRVTCRPASRRCATRSPGAVTC